MVLGNLDSEPIICYALIYKVKVFPQKNLANLYYFASSPLVTELFTTLFSPQGLREREREREREGKQGTWRSFPEISAR